MKQVIKYALLGLGVVALGLVGGFFGPAIAQNVSCYFAQGGATFHATSGCTVSIETGSTLDIDSGATFTDAAGFTSTATISAEQLTSTDDATVTDQLTVAEVLNTDNVGTAGTNVTAAEAGDGWHHLTKLTLSSVAYTIGDDAALCDSALIYTFPDGEVVVESVSSQVAISLTTGTPTSDTPEICVGTTAGSGANATCGAEAATLEDLGITDVAADIAGTNNVQTSIGPTADTAGFVVADAAAHTVYLNICDTWADVDDTAATISGTIYVRWSWYGNPA